jgi:hypothetical protein
MGYLVTWTSYTYAAEYKGIVYEALGLTLLIIGVLTVLYSKGIIRVTSRFRKVVYTTLLVSILGGLIFFVMTLVAPNSGIVRAIIQANNGPIGIVFGIIGVMLASAVLTCDFDNAAKTVEQVKLVRSLKDTSDGRFKWLMFCNETTEILPVTQGKMALWQYDIFHTSGHKLDPDAILTLLRRPDEKLWRLIFEWEEIDDNVKMEISSNVKKWPIYKEVMKNKQG